MKIKFLGHAAFLITSKDGVRIITDPYKPGCFDGGIKYEPITEEANIVSISHEHDDHNETAIAGHPSFVREAVEKDIEGIKMKGIRVHHDESGGKERGMNTIYNMLIDDLNVVHLGDLGHALSKEDAAKIGKVDILLIPVGGHFTIDAKSADAVIKLLKPRVAIPMHFKTDKCGFPIAPVEDFTKGKDVRKIDGELELSKETLPPETTIYVLPPSK
ncbi:MAG: MBL fold metallo-hydrolase [candidate division WOR-3 bacterium]|nr:MAG: MBL fold metallo-hydrolase [candidate division WOR-3 bacterium]